MNEKKLISKLNKISDLKPDASWKEENRNILLSQLSGTTKDEKSSVLDILQLPVLILRSVSQPVLVVFMFMFVSGSGFLGVNVVQNSQPGDSLYNTKLAGEKARVALTFDEKEKVRLGIVYASKRAKEIDMVLTSDDSVNQTKDETVKKLMNDFNKEIDGIKLRISKFDKKEEVVAMNPKVASKEVDTTEEVSENKTEDEIEALMFSASLNKDDRGIKLGGNASGSIGTEEAESNTEATTQEVVVSTTSKEVASSTEEAVDTQTFFDEAKELLNDEDYNATISKLEEASKAITGNTEDAASTTTPSTTDDDGEVLGDEEIVETTEAEESSSTDVEIVD